MVKSTETEIAVLQTQMTEVKTSLESIKAEQHINFAALSVKIDLISTATTEVENIKIRLAAVEKSKDREWIRNTGSAVVGIVLSSLIWYVIHKP